MFLSLGISYEEWVKCGSEKSGILRGIRHSSSAVIDKRFVNNIGDKTL